MSVLSPTILWLLGAVAIPIIIHFLSRLRVKKVEFSTVRFIKKLETSSIRRIKIQQLILMILRMLTIAALIFMVAQPVIQGFMPGWIASDQDARLVLVLDNSASMNVKNGDETFLEIIKTEALALLPQFNDKTHITLFQTCPPKRIYDGVPSDPKLVSVLSAIHSTVSHDYLWENLSIFLKDPTMVEPIKECVVFSDLTHSPDSTFLAGHLEKEKWKFYFIRPGHVRDNLSIRSVSSINRIKTPNQLVKLKTRVQNSGELQKPNTHLELLFNGNRVGQVVSNFVPHKEKEFIFQAYPGQTGIVQAVATLPSDDYDMDNNWYVSMPVLDRVRCGIIASNNEGISMIEMILHAIDPEGQLLSVESRIQSNLNRLFLDDLDVAIIHDPLKISQAGTDDLDKYLKSGGGLIWFQGKGGEDDYHPDLYDKLEFPRHGKVIDSGQGFFNSEILIENSDIFGDLLVRKIENELPEIFTYVETEILPDHKIHLDLNNDDPLLIEFSRKSGAIFYFSTLLDLRWNDLLVRGLTIPLIYRMLVLAGTDEFNTAPILVDGSKWISIEEDILRNKWEVESPSGKMELIAPDYDREGINVTSTHELGIFNIFSNGKLFTSFPTRLHDKEYIHPGISQARIEPYLSTDQIRLMAVQDDFAKAFLEARQGKSLWKIFLLATVVLLLAETLIGRPVSVKMKAADI